MSGKCEKCGCSEIIGPVYQPAPSNMHGRDGLKYTCINCGFWWLTKTDQQHEADQRERSRLRR